MATNDVIVRLRAIGQAAFTAAMDEAASSVGKVGTNADKAGDQTDAMGKAAGKAAPRWKTFAGGLAKWAGGAAAIYAAKRGLDATINSTMDLAKTTLMLKRATGLDAEEASAWGTVTKARGIETKQFQVSLVKLSRQMEAARTGNEKAADSFAALGISQAAIRTGNVQDALLGIGDAMSKMTNPAEKAALAQSMFGRSGQALVPLLEGGTKGIQEQLDMATKYGAVLGTDATGSAGDFIKRQREMKIAFEGLKVSAGTALLPVITSLSTALLSLTQIMQPLLRNTTLVKVTIGLLTAAFVAYKIAVIASTVASLGMIAVWAAIPVAIAAIAAGLVIAYKKVGWFRKAVNAVFNWIKGHWPLLVGILTGPFGALVILAVKNFDKIKRAFSDVFNAIKNTARSIPKWFLELGKSIVTGIVNGIKSSPGRILDAIKGLLPGGGLGRKLAGIVGLQGGGVLRSGSVFVGERGPEVLQMKGGGARVFPLPSSSVAPVPAMPGLGDATIVVPVSLDGRVLTEVVAQRTADRKARR